MGPAHQPLPGAESGVCGAGRRRSPGAGRGRAGGGRSAGSPRPRRGWRSGRERGGSGGRTMESGPEEYELNGDLRPGSPGSPDASVSPAPPAPLCDFGRRAPSLGPAPAAPRAPGGSGRQRGASALRGAGVPVPRAVSPSGGPGAPATPAGARVRPGGAHAEPRGGGAWAPPSPAFRSKL